MNITILYSIRGLRPRTPYTLARGGPRPRSARVAHSLRSFALRATGASPPNPLHARSRGPQAPLRSRGSLAALVRAALAARGLVQLADDAVLNPVGVPPFDWVHHLSVHQHREVEVIAAGETRHAALAHFLFFVDHLSGLHGDRRQVPVQRLDAHAVVQDDAVAVDAERRRVEDFAAVRRENGRVDDA